MSHSLANEHVEKEQDMLPILMGLDWTMDTSINVLTQQRIQKEI
jgi:hypothetical protein